MDARDKQMTLIADNYIRKGEKESFFCNLIVFMIRTLGLDMQNMHGAFFDTPSIMSIFAYKKDRYVDTAELVKIQSL